LRQLWSTTGYQKNIGIFLIKNISFKLRKWSGYFTYFLTKYIHRMARINVFTWIEKQINAYLHNNKNTKQIGISRNKHTYNSNKSKCCKRHSEHNSLIWSQIHSDIQTFWHIIILETHRRIQITTPIHWHKQLKNVSIYNHSFSKTQIRMYTYTITNAFLHTYQFKLA